MDGCDVFYVERATLWTFANGLGVKPKADLEAIDLAILILRQEARPSLCRGTTRGIIDRELGGHCTYDGFYKYQVPLMYKAVFRPANLEPGP